MDSIVARHLPLITNRISFTFQPPPPLQPLTNRKEFLDVHEPSESTLPNPPASLNKASPVKYSGSVQFGFQKDKAADMEEEIDDEGDRSDEDGEGTFASTALIPKPPGEPGRPHSGGYSLDEVLSPWGETLVKVTVGSAASCCGYRSYSAPIWSDIHKRVCRQGS